MDIIAPIQFKLIVPANKTSVVSFLEEILNSKGFFCVIQFGPNPDAGHRLYTFNVFDADEFILE